MASSSSRRASRSASLLIEKLVAGAPTNSPSSYPSSSRSRRLTFTTARRALGVVNADRAELRSALQIYERLRAAHRIARLQPGIGDLDDDPSLVQRGLAKLEGLGDLEHLERVRQRDERVR